MPFLVEAMIRLGSQEPYRKMIFVDECPDVDIHMGHLIRQGYQVASVKSRPADEVEMNEYANDRHGNLKLVDNTVTIVPSEEIDAAVVSDSTTDTDTRSD